jgi:hypothetical protein
MTLGLYYDDEKVLGDNMHAASTYEAYTFPVTRAQSKTTMDGELVKQVRFEEEKIPPPWKKVYKVPLAEQGNVPMCSEAEKVVPSAPHPANTEEGWQQQLRDKREESDGTAMGSQFKAKSSPFCFTSSIQEQVSADDVQEQILGTKIILSLCEILGMSPEL